MAHAHCSLAEPWWWWLGAQGPRYVCADAGDASAARGGILQLCELCFATRSYPEWLAPASFARLGAVSEDVWTREETARLLNALERSVEDGTGEGAPAAAAAAAAAGGGEEDVAGPPLPDQPPAIDWTAVASAVGTRTPAECVRRFLAMPIESSVAGAGSGGRARDFGDVPRGTALGGVAFPFGDEAHPAVALASALVALADPVVVAAATSAAVGAAKRARTEEAAGSGGGAAAAAALGVAAARATALAEETEKESMRLMCELGELMVAKVCVRARFARVRLICGCGS
jgi:hypothetical protein